MRAGLFSNSLKRYFENRLNPGKRNKKNLVDFLNEALKSGRQNDFHSYMNL